MKYEHVYRLKKAHMPTFLFVGLGMYSISLASLIYNWKIIYKQNLFIICGFYWLINYNLQT